MEARIADQNTTKYPLGRLIAEGKTKRIYEVRNNPDLVLIVSKNDITAGDGAKHDVLEGKAAWSTTTTCNVFELLKHNVTLAYIERDNENSFVAHRCDMLPFEVVVRREAHGSYLKRYPSLKKGDLLGGLVEEIFLKTKDRKWETYDLPCDDPLLIWDDSVVRLYNPAMPFEAQKPFLELPAREVFPRIQMGDILLSSLMSDARLVFIRLEVAWKKQGGRLVDFKVEYGRDQEGKIRLADVIDNDSWRVIMDDSYIDKQVYRDGGSLDEVAAQYEKVAQITARFLD